MIALQVAQVPQPRRRLNVNSPGCNPGWRGCAKTDSEGVECENLGLNSTVKSEKCLLNYRIGSSYASCPDLRHSTPSESPEPVITSPRIAIRGYSYSTDFAVGRAEGQENHRFLSQDIRSDSTKRFGFRASHALTSGKFL
jgi:hypothetical protein